jgi:hypothetical protein
MADNEPMIQKNIRLPQGLWERIETIAGKGRVTEFIRTSCEERLRPIELERTVERLRQKVEGDG